MRYRKREWQGKLVDKYLNSLVFENLEFIKDDKKINIEIGCGKGDFIIDQAQKNREEIFVGIERVKSVLAMALKKVLDEKIDNVFFICEDASKVLDEQTKKVEIANIYLNFSDPWPKKRHAKRRLTSPLFLAKYKKLLNRDGKIMFKTDNNGLFEYSLDQFKENNFDLIFISRDYKSEDNSDDSTTEYEQKYKSRGVKINRLVATLRK